LVRVFGVMPVGRSRGLSFDIPFSYSSGPPSDDRPLT
jgi:hypothetical protein